MPIEFRWNLVKRRLAARDGTESGKLFACDRRAKDAGLLKVFFGEAALELFPVQLASHEECLDVARVDSEDDSQIIDGTRRLALLLMELSSE